MRFGGAFWALTEILELLVRQTMMARTPVEYPAYLNIRSSSVGSPKPTSAAYHATMVKTMYGIKQVT
jgi:hypothetical protein